VFWEYFWDVLGMCSGCVGDVLGMLSGCFGDVLGMFWECFLYALWMSSAMFWGYFREVLGDAPKDAKLGNFLTPVFLTLVLRILD